MVFAPVDPMTKEKIIAAHLAGHGRNQIDREMAAQGIKVSHGSITNIINAYKRKHQQPSPQQQPLPLLQPLLQASSGLPPGSNNAGISTADIHNMNIGECSHLLSGKGKSTSDSSVTPRDGGPLTHFFSGKDEDTMTVPDSISSADGSPAPLKPQVEDADVINSPEEPNPRLHHQL